MSTPIGRRFVVKKYAITTYNNLGTPFTSYIRDVVGHDLYPTKGWRFAKRYRDRLMRSDWLKVEDGYTEFVPNPHATVRRDAVIGPSDAGRLMRGRTPRPMPITERMLMRHGWYRRKLRKEGIAIDPNAKNAMVLR
jgi:hypothetical protein